MGWDDWRDDDGQPDASTSHHHQQHQQKQQQKRRRLLLASLRQPDSTPSKGGGKASGGGSGGGGGAASLLGGMGGMQLLATALRPVPGVGARAKGRGELLSRPPVRVCVLVAEGFSGFDDGVDGLCLCCAWQPNLITPKPQHNTQKHRRRRAGAPPWWWGAGTCSTSRRRRGTAPVPTATRRGRRCCTVRVRTRFGVMV